MRSLLPCLLLLGACTDSDPSYDADCPTLAQLLGTCTSTPPDGGGGGGGGGSTGGWEPIGKGPPAFADGIAPADGCDSRVCPIAAGGTGLITVSKNQATGITIDVGAGPAQLTLWYTSVARVQYLVTATSVAGETPVAVRSDNYDPLTTTVVTELVSDVRLVPPRAYRAATASPAFMYETSRVAIAILGDGDTAPVRLVDSTLAVTSPALSSFGWDLYQLPATPGTYSVEVAAASFGTRQLEADIVETIDRLDAVVDGTPTLTSSATVCFHAYQGEREVYARFAIETSNSVSLERETNCARVQAETAGTIEVTASAFGLAHTVELVVP